MDKEAEEKIAEILRYADTSENPVLIPDSLKGDYLKAARKIIAFMEELGYCKLPSEWDEQAEMMGRLIDRGWIAPEEAKNYMLKPKDKPPLLNDERIQSAMINTECKIISQKPHGDPEEEATMQWRAIAQAQRDSDIKHYEGAI